MVSVALAVDVVPVLSIGLEVLIPLNDWSTTCMYTEPFIVNFHDESPG